VNTVQTRHKVFPILGEAIASCRVKRQTAARKQPRFAEVNTAHKRND